MFRVGFVAAAAPPLTASTMRVFGPYFFSQLSVHLIKSIARSLPCTSSIASFMHWTRSVRTVFYSLNLSKYFCMPSLSTGLPMKLSITFSQQAPLA